MADAALFRHRLVASVKQGYHLSHCPNFRGHLSEEGTRQRHPRLEMAGRNAIPPLAVGPLDGEGVTKAGLQWRPLTALPLEDLGSV